MSDSYDIAVVGAAGIVGEAIVSLLEERDFPVRTLTPLEQGDAVGDIVSFKGHNIRARDLTSFDFAQTQIVFLACPGDLAAEYGPKAVAAGCFVIHTTSPASDEALVVAAEANPEAVRNSLKTRTIYSAAPPVVLLLAALKPIHDAAGIERFNVATYQAVADCGKEGIEELAGQTANLLNARPIRPSVFPKQIAFNVIGQVGPIEDNGYSREEMRLAQEVQRILGDDATRVNVTAVQVPVFFGHSMAVHIETREKIGMSEARELLGRVPGISVAGHGRKETVPTPVSEAANSDKVFVGRIREDISHPRGLNLWIVGDNIRRGIALNSVQIAEILVKDVL